MNIANINEIYYICRHKLKLKIFCSSLQERISFRFLFPKYAGTVSDLTSILLFFCHHLMSHQFFLSFENFHISYIFDICTSKNFFSRTQFLSVELLLSTIPSVLRRLQLCSTNLSSLVYFNNPDFPF